MNCYSSFFPLNEVNPNVQNPRDLGRRDKDPSTRATIEKENHKSPLRNPNPLNPIHVLFPLVTLFSFFRVVGSRERRGGAEQLRQCNLYLYLFSLSMDTLLSVLSSSSSLPVALPPRPSSKHSHRFSPPHSSLYLDLPFMTSGFDLRNLFSLPFASLFPVFSAHPFPLSCSLFPGLSLFCPPFIFFV